MPTCRAANATSLGSRGWGGVVKRTVSEFRRDNLTDLAAALTVEPRDTRKMLDRRDAVA